jgi:hypothetical protein
MIIVNGKEVEGGSKVIAMTQDEYNALSAEDKSNSSIVYFIYDGDEEHYRQLVQLRTLVGSPNALETYTNQTTVIGAIMDIYRRLGGMSISLDPTNSHINLSYDPADVTPAVVPDDISHLTDDQKIEYLISSIGVDDNAAIESFHAAGFTNIVGALLSIYTALNGVELAINANEDALEVSYDDGEVSE